jgi:peptidoglycan lytic transglycosylase
MTAVPPSQPPPSRPVITGRASWYGEAHHGLVTASGERFDMHALTAAHRSLPFGTRLRVVNLANGEAVEVRVNDRGPAIPGRILDLSYAAARKLGAVGAGVIPVRITVLSD